MDIQCLKTIMIAEFKRVGYSKGNIKKVHSIFNYVIRFMDSIGKSEYTPDIGKAFLTDRYGTAVWEELDKYAKSFGRQVRMMDYWLEHEKIAPIKERTKKAVFDGDIGEPFRLFMDYANAQYHEKTAQHHRYRLGSFFKFLNEKNKSIADVDSIFVISYLTGLRSEKSLFERYATIMTLRAFFRYLCSNGFLSDNNISRWEAILALPKYLPNKIPSVYTEEEVNRILSSIDRTSALGKRNYAMILLAARYGLRASDIIGLRHCNIDWDLNVIKVRQAKTGKEIELPLFEEIGSSIIDYLKYGRPKSDLPYIFLTHGVRTGVMKTTTLSGCVANAMRSAGIDSTGKRKGTHTLRHSLASNLLKANEGIPVISEILGHESTDTTKIYLQIDTGQLLKCALEVPFVNSTFYENLYR